jgi:hypothetical protein
MNIAIFGANGPTGQLLTKQALAEGHAVTAVTRHPEAFPLHQEHLQVLRADVFDLSEVEAAVAGQDAVLSTLGVLYSFKPITIHSQGTTHIVQAMTHTGVRRLVCVSSSATDPRTRYHDTGGGFFVEKILKPIIITTLTTILVRLCMDQLQLACRKREQYVGPWLPEPILTEAIPEAADPQERVEKEESISLAFLILLEQLQPFERAVFLLREVFEYEFMEIAEILSKSEAACRRSFSRAKHHLRAQRPRFQPAKETHQQLRNSFLQAVTTVFFLSLGFFRLSP